MNKKYSLVLVIFLGFVWSGFTPEKEHFTNCDRSRGSSAQDSYNDARLIGSTYNMPKATTVSGPKIKVKSDLGKFPTIANGSLTPQGPNGTLFSAQYIGASQSKSYRILNEGTSNLTISNINILGTNSEDFTITVTPEVTILPGTFSILEIEFSPLAAGMRNATVYILSDDDNENPYIFAIRGTGVCVATSNTISPLNGPTGTIVTITGTNFDATATANLNGISMVKSVVNTTTIEAVVPAGVSTGNIVVVNGIGCTSTIPFEVIDNQIGGCEGNAVLSDLFISEITDATVGGLSYIEIYNGTGTTKHLGDYTIGIYSNGAATPSGTITLNPFILLNNKTYILAIGMAGSPNSSNTCPNPGGNGLLADQLSSVAGINKKDNQHDAIRLLKSGGTEVVDEFGVYMDNTWMDATIITGDRGFNFRRLNTASVLPNPNFNLSDWNVIDWVGSGPGSCHTNDYSNIGIFDYSGGTPPTIMLQPAAPLSNCDITTSLTVVGIEGAPYGRPLTYQWFYNAPENFDWIEILNTNPDYAGQQSPNLNILSNLNLDQYQYYAQIREDGATCYKASEAIRLNVQKTLWNGTTWNPLPPNSDTIVILNENYTTTPITGSFAACNLIVNSGFSLNITNGYYVEVYNNVVVNATSPANFGEIIVESMGAFVQRGDDIDAGTFKLINTARARVNKSTAVKQKWYDYTYWGSPVNNETIESVLNISSPSRRFYFEAANYDDTNGDDVDDNGDDWQLASGRMIPGVGYASTSNGSLSFPRIDVTAFNGEFNTGNIPVAIHTNSNPDDKDWNFLGNPYASAIDFKLLYNLNKDVIDGAAYLWSHASPPSIANPGNQVLNFSGADYAIITVGSGTTAGPSKETPSDYIPSGQGFFVVGLNSGGTLNFKNSMRMADATSNAQFFRNSTPDLSNKFWINLTSDNGIFNQILVAYVEGATDGFDGFAYDAERNSASGLQAMVYTQIPESPKKYAIQGKHINSLTLDEAIPLGFYTVITQPTIFTLSIAQTQGSFFEENSVFLKDNFLHGYHNLSTSDYNFTSGLGEFNDRFEIIFKNQILSAKDAQLDFTDLTITELSNGQVQFSTSHQLTITSVEIMDLLGRNLYILKGSQAIEIYDLSNLSQAAYIARVTFSNGQTLTKRAIKRL